MVSSYKLLYSIAIIPFNLAIYNLIFFLIIYFKIKYSFYFSCVITIRFAFLFPIYLYFALHWYDKFKANLRRFFLRVMYFNYYFKTGKDKLKELIQIKFNLQRKVINLINFYQDTILQQEEEEILKEIRKQSETNLDGQISKALRSLSEIK